MTALEKRQEFERSNLDAALIIVADEDGYGGPESLAVKWAKATLARHGHLPLTVEQERAA